MFFVMFLWAKGRSLVAEYHVKNQLSVKQFVATLEKRNVLRTPGTGYYLSATSQTTPMTVNLQLEHFQSLPARLVFLTVVNESSPYVEDAKRYHIRLIGKDIWSFQVHCGFMEMPDVRAAVTHLPPEHLEKVTYYLSHETFTPLASPAFPAWQEYCFLILVRNSLDVSLYFNLPCEQVVEMGARIAL